MYMSLIMSMGSHNVVVMFHNHDMLLVNTSVHM